MAAPVTGEPVRLPATDARGGKKDARASARATERVAPAIKACWTPDYRSMRRCQVLDLRFQVITPPIDGSKRQEYTGAMKPATTHSEYLPGELNPFIGREREISVVRDLVRAGGRLVSLTGPGGVGKTRLALQVIAGMAQEFPDGVHVVSLAPVTEPDLVVSTIARTFGLHDSVGRSLKERLFAHLEKKSLLLMLDNFEQLLEAAPTVAELLAVCPEVRVLVTSREILHLSAERHFPVPPLSIPDVKHLPPLDALSSYSAVVLFTQQAQAVKPGFALTETNAADVVEITARLDGLPLAIALAAARIALLPPSALLVRLSRHTSLRLLTGGALDLPERQRTLRATIAWSYDLLDPEEQQLFRHLSIFVGGCDVDAIEAISGDDVLDGVASLIDKNLLRHIELDHDSRLTMLETIREFGVSQLDSSGEGERVRHRHALYYMHLSEEGEPHFTDPDLRSWLDRLERELDNLRASIRWSLENGRPEIALRICGALWRFMVLRGLLREGGAWLEEALATGGESSPSVRARALNASALVAVYRGLYERGAVHGTASLALARDIGDRKLIAASLSALAMATREPGNFAHAVELYEESLAIYRELGDTHGIAYVLLQEGLALWGEKNFSGALSALEESLRLYREDGDAWGAASALHALGTGAYYQQQFEKARSLLTEGLACAHALEHGILTSMCLSGLSWVAAGEGRFREAVELYRVAETYRAVVGVSPTPGMRATSDAMLEKARNALSGAEFTRASERGRMMTVEQVIADQVRNRQRHPSQRVRPAGLTRREVEVLRLVATGMTNAEVADRLVVSPRTIDAHLLSIYGKLEINSRSAATRFAVEQGIV